MMLDLGLFAFGAALVGLGVAVSLVTFGVVENDSTLSTGAALVSALILGVVGSFAMGIASEGPVRRPSRAVINSDWHAAIARAVSAALVGWLFIFLSEQLSPFVVDFPAPLAEGAELLRSAGMAGLWPVPLIGVPLAWGIKRSGFFGDASIEAELPIMFTTWVLALIYFR
jgi:hypothetical protein